MKREYLPISYLKQTRQTNCQADLGEPRGGSYLRLDASLPYCLGGFRGLVCIEFQSNSFYALLFLAEHYLIYTLARTF